MLAILGITAPIFILVGIGFLACRSELISREQAAGMGDQPLARIGRRHAPARALKQLVAELVLQILDPHRDRRLRAAEPGTGGSEPAGLGHGDEHAQRREIEMPVHGVPPCNASDPSILRMVKSV